MSGAGWVLMVASVGLTTGFFVWCLQRVLRSPDSVERIHGVLDTERKIEARDRD
jgi:hypothetical protein